MKSARATKSVFADVLAWLARGGARASVTGQRKTPLVFAALLLSCSPAPESASRDAGADVDAPDVAQLDVGSPDADLPDSSLADGGLTDVDASEDDVRWRSALYPEDWSPQAGPDGEGRVLHDFSYAGYRYGEDPMRPAEQARFDVVEFGADASGEADATPAIQAAIDAAEDAGGGEVFLPAGLYRVDDTLEVSASNIVIRGAGPQATRLHFTRFEGMSLRAHLTISGGLWTSAESPLVADLPARSTWVEVADASAFSAGDDVHLGWVITDEFIEDHQMSGTWEAFNGRWQTFFRRTVVEVDQDAGRVRLDVPTRYPALVRDGAALRHVEGYVSEVGVESLGIANAVSWEVAWSEVQVHAIALKGVKDAWVRDVVSFRPTSAPEEGPGSEGHLLSSGILVAESKRVTVADVTLENAQNRGPGGCGYLFEIRASSEVLTRDSVGRGGRHNFIQNWGFGTTGAVWLRVLSEEGRVLQSAEGGLTSLGLSDFHHSLATANLVDQSILNDGWSAQNRQGYSSGAGHSATENVFWNIGGEGLVRSLQFGWGYVIGTGEELGVDTSLRPEIEDPSPLGNLASWEHTAPEDWVEGEGRGALLEPQSLYEDQRRRRLEHGETPGD